MPFDSDLSHDASLQQGEYLELWETTRFTQRQDPLAGDHVQIFHPVKDESGQHDVDLPRNHELGAERLVPIKVEPEEMDEPVENAAHVIEDRHRQGNEESSDIRAGGPPTWLSTSALRQPNQSPDDRENASQGEAEKWCPETNATASLNRSTYAHWLPVKGTGMHASSSQHRQEEHGGMADDKSELGINRQQTRVATELNLTGAHGRSPQPPLEPPSHPPAAASRSPPEESNRADSYPVRQGPEWEEARRRCLIVNHPLYPDMLAKHAACLRVGTPVDQLPDIEAQLLQAPEVTEKYRVLRDQITDVTPEEQADLDQFMIEYPFVLGSFKELLQHHVYTDVTEAMMSCWEMEQALLNLTGARPTQGSGATMSDDEVEDNDSDFGSHDQATDCHDSGGFGPLVPSESERTLMERVRKELKHELKQGYKSKLEDVREEILRKRRAGKLPEGTTAILKGWWQAHSKWPYPTEEEKEILIQETGLELKQVNNWFINQRKRNWQSNPMTSSGPSDPKGKVRKSW